MTSSGLPAWKKIALIPLTLGLIAAFVLMTTLEHLTRQGYTFLLYFGIAFSLYVAALFLLWNVESSTFRNLLIIVFGAAILMRVPLWFTEPTLSTDIWRYVWDGHLVSRGMNPYAERVDSPVFDGSTYPLRERVEHQWMATPYPPAAQLTFGAVQSVFPGSATALQVVFTLFDLASGAVLVGILRRTGRPTGRTILYLWNPLVVLEFAHSAHVDSLMILLILIALRLAIDKRGMQSAIGLALATLTKFIPALLLPAFVRRWGWRRTLVYAAIVVLGFAPFIGAGLGLSSQSDGTGLLGAARIYLLSWETNGGVFHWLMEGFSILGVGGAFLAAKIVGLLVLIGTGGFIWLESAGSGTACQTRLIGGVASLISAYTLMSSAVFPWYLIWLIAVLPLLPVRRQPAWWPFIAGWVYFSGAINLSYLFYLDPENVMELDWVRLVEYLPLFVMLSTGALKRFQQARSPR